MIHHHYRFKKFTSLELFELLEHELKNACKLSTGLNPYCLPDQEWMCNILLHLDKEDKNGLLGPKVIDKETFNVEINPE